MVVDEGRIEEKVEPSVDHDTIDELLRMLPVADEVHLAAIEDEADRELRTHGQHTQRDADPEESVQERDIRVGSHPPGHEPGQPRHDDRRERDPHGGVRQSRGEERHGERAAHGNHRRGRPAREPHRHPSCRHAVVPVWRSQTSNVRSAHSFCP